LAGGVGLADALAMSRYLIVAHDTATSPSLIERVRELRDEEPGREFALLVPATPVGELKLARARSGDADADATARQRAQEAQEAFAEAGVPLADTRAGVAAPREAIAAEMGRHPDYDGFVISTLPEEESQRLKMRSGEGRVGEEGRSRGAAYQ